MMTSMQKKSRRNWTPEEVAFVKDNDAVMPVSELCRRLGRNKGSVDKLRRDLGLRKDKDRPWTADELRFLEVNPTLKSKEIGAILGRSHGSVSGKRSLSDARMQRTCITCGDMFTSRWAATKVCRTCDPSQKWNGVSLLRRYEHYKRGAQKRGLPFELDHRAFFQFWQKPCTYCGSEIETIGMDRLEPSQGYVAGNVVSCCSRCNEMKMDATREEWVVQMKRVLKHMGEL